METTKSDEERDVLKCLEKEETAARMLADAKAETGEALMRLEAAKQKEGVNRSVWVARLMDLCRNGGYEPMTATAISTRKRIASWRHKVPPEMARSCMGLRVTQQKLLAGCPTLRLEEFLNDGIPIRDHGRKAIQEAKDWEVRRAVHYAKTIKMGDEIWIQAKSDDEWHRKPSLMDLAEKALNRLGHLTREQAAMLVLILADLLSKGPQPTTRRLSVPVGPEAAPEPEVRASKLAEEVAEALDKLRTICRDIKFNAAWEGGALRARICTRLAELLYAVCRWDRPVERLTG
jgi:hypothetical protein